MPWNRLMHLVYVVTFILLVKTNVDKNAVIGELEWTVDYLSSPENEIVVVIDENLKSKQDRTRVKIEDLIASNHYQPLSSDDLDNLSRIVVKYSYRYTVPVNLVLAVITAESAFDRQAVSSTGALGLMQVMPTTAVEIAHELGVSTYDPFALDDGVRFGTYYLRKMLKAFGGDLELAVRAYNAGVQNISKGNYPDETVAYHESVMRVYHWLETRRFRCDTSD